MCSAQFRERKGEKNDSPSPEVIPVWCEVMTIKHFIWKKGTNIRIYTLVIKAGKASSEMGRLLGLFAKLFLSVGREDMVVLCCFILTRHRKRWKLFFQAQVWKKASQWDGLRTTTVFFLCCLLLRFCWPFLNWGPEQRPGRGQGCSGARNEC